jgi:Patatin-like phospholipase
VICSRRNDASDELAPLTEWLADELDRIAGKSAGSGPLTFGDLNGRGIRLSMLTTDLSAGTQNELPFRSRMWAFSPDEFAKLFPQRIVDWLKDHPAPESDTDAEVFARFRAKGLCPMPLPENLPVIVAVRMSLSFPILLSTVPLHAIDYTRPNQPIVRHQFSDGGITSNFPIHFFDAAIPGQPTFGINLVKVDTLDPDPGKNVSIPETDREGILPPANEIGRLTEFVRALANTIQNWSDSMQTRVPGYRDRIVAVNHTKNEGGINLDMDSEVVAALAERGRHAGLCAHNFDFVNHRWIRLRSMLQTLEAFVSPAAKKLDAERPRPDIPTYREMMAAPPPPSYRNPTIAEEGPTVVNAIVGLAHAYESVLQDDGTSRFESGAPPPPPRLAVRPQP